jgi:hypothetical protein
VLAYTLTLDRGMTTSVQVFLDNEPIARVRHRDTFVVSNDTAEHDVFHNRAHDGAPQEFSFGLVDLVELGRHSQPEEYAGALYYMKSLLELPDANAILYLPQGYGHSPAGGTFRPHGPCKKSTIREIVSGGG